MSSTTSKALVGDLVAADRDSEPGEGAGTRANPPSPPREPPPGPSDAPEAEDNQPMSMKPPPESLRLTKDEIVALTELSPYLGGSPRRARRFVNVYRVAKASLPWGEVKKLEDGEYKALATQLAIATGAPNAFAAWVDICATAEDDSVDQRISAMEASEDERQNIDRALATFRRMPSNAGDHLRQLAEQSAHAGRFSFAMPRRATPPMPGVVAPPSSVRGAAPSS
jgi:hypothetical protein